MDEEKGLVRSNDRELLYAKLKEIRIQGLTAKTKAAMDAIEEVSPEYYIMLAWRIFGVSRKQLKNFSDKELKMLDDEIARKATPWAILQATSCVLLAPIIWFPPLFMTVFSINQHNGFGCVGYISLKYLWRCRRALKKAYGKDYFSPGEVRNRC